MMLLTILKNNQVRFSGVFIGHTRKRLSGINAFCAIADQ